MNQGIRAIMEAMLSSQHSFVSYLFRSKMSNQPVNGMILQSHTSVKLIKLLFQAFKMYLSCL